MPDPRRGSDVLRGTVAEHPRVKLLPLVPPAAVPVVLPAWIVSCTALPRSGPTFGRIVMEAMACGLPVVCERDSGAAEYIEHGETGFLVDSDQEALETVLMLKGDPSLRGRIGAAACRASENGKRRSDRCDPQLLPSERGIDERCARSRRGHGAETFGPSRGASVPCSALA